MEDLRGLRFGSRVVTDTPSLLCGNQRKYQCLCDCGYSSWVLANNLKRKEYKSCIKCRERKPPIPLYGMKVGKKQIISEVPKKTGRSYLWTYLCDCGYQGVINSHRFLKNTYKDCPSCSGILSKGEDAVKKSPLWRKWGSIKSRCYNLKAPNYKHYGGRGITLEEYFHDFKNFEKWVIENLGPPQKGLSLDRVDNEKGYQRGNLRWATGAEQNLNRRDGFFTLIPTSDGREITVREYASLHSLTTQTVRYKMKTGEISFKQPTLGEGKCH